MARLQGLAAAAAFIFAIASAPARAACTVDTQAILFSGYSPFSQAPVSGLGSVHVACDASTNFVVALGPGQNSSTFPDRYLKGNVSNYLLYNLYTNASHSTIWGDGTAGTVTVSGSGTSINLPVYGQIPASQNKQADTYTDQVGVTVTF